MAMKRKLLLFLADALMKNARDPKGSKFDLEAWVTRVNKKKPLSCGTTACAFGFAALLPKFKKLGLRLEMDEPIEGYGEAAFYPCYKGYVDFMAASKFFGVDRRIAEHLFSPDNYRDDHQQEAAGERAVAMKIYDLLDGVDITKERY